jgi:CRP-like cAMP-binding protein
VSGTDQGRIEGILRNLPIFRHTTAEHVTELARSAHALRARRGTTLYARGDTAHGFYAVAYGMVKLFIASSNDERVLRLVGAGETFGEPVVFMARPYPLSAQTIADSMLVFLPSQAVLGMVDRDSQFARGLLAALSQRVHDFVADLESRSHTCVQRLALMLDSLAPPGSGPVRVVLPASKTVLASRLGVTKATLSRAFAHLQSAGLIAVERRAITLRSRDGLLELAQSGHAIGVDPGQHRPDRTAHHPASADPDTKEI